MKEFSRQPTAGERLLGIGLSAVLLVFLAMLAIALALSGSWVAGAVCVLLSSATAVIFWRASFGSSRALTRRQRSVFAWVLLVLGFGCIAFVALADGDRTDSLLALGGASTILSAGIAGLRYRGQDA